MSHDAFRPRPPVPPPPAHRPPTFAQLQADPQTGVLRAARRSALTVLGAVLGLYLLYSLLAVAAPGLLAVRLLGDVNVGMGLGLLLGALCLAAVQWYTRRARTRIDPAAARIRASFEGEGER
ncbi:DUF485 domain-containing protein [Streptomyces sp. NPDC058739]|uniref:DUF485 domain-containing protein n=1 Tax=Streptomyces sp. NPDC058739 TaxID=3346618 RepID=UPI0036B3D83A